MPEHACLAGTRTSLLKTIDEWTTSSDSVYWLTGPAGAGKSTIAATVALRAAEKGILGGSFFLHRDFSEQRNAHLVVNSLAFELAQFDSQIAKGIRKVLTRYPDLPSSLSLQKKFLGLIIEPIKDASISQEFILLVIDDLDALDDGKATYSTLRQDFLSCLANLESDLPSTLKIFLTSRPEIDILEEFPSSWRHPLDLGATETQDDLKLFTTSCMTKITKKYSHLELVKKSCGLFIWIQTVYRFLKQRDPKIRLETVLSSQSLSDAESELDKLYMRALLHHPDTSDLVFYNRFQQVVGGMVVLFEPLSSTSLDSLFKLSFHSDDIVSSLQSFLQHTDEQNTVQFIHPSFSEFLSDKTRCKNDQLRIDKNFQHSVLAKTCLVRMHEMLKRNICDLDPLQLNGEIIDMDERIIKHIPRDLQYACQYWGYHIHSMPELNAEVFELVKDFFQDTLLYWLEILSLLEKMGFILETLNIVHEKFELLILMEDSKKFVYKFYHLIGQSTLHIYDSALAFTPQQTIFYENFSCKWEKYVKVLNGILLQWSTLITVCEGHHDRVTCVAFSPDGSQIVSGSHDTTLCLWDAKSGAAIGEPLKGH
ncbi:hypothetical protein BD410DRAFT_889978, partial [Rickenella mellea]